MHMIAPKTDMAISAISISGSLYLDCHDSAHGEITHDLKTDGRAQQRLAHRLREEQAHVAGVPHHEAPEHEHRQAADDDTRHLLLRSERVDLATDTLALSHGGGHFVQDFGQVTADCALDVDGREHHVKVAAVDALAKSVEGVFRAHAQVGLAEHPADLQRDGGGHLPRGELEALHETVTGLQRVGNESEEVDELLVDPVDSASLLIVDPHRREHVPDNRQSEADSCVEGAEAEDERQYEEHPGHAPTNQVVLAHTGGDGGALQVDGHSFRAAKLGEESAEDGKTTVRACLSELGFRVRPGGLGKRSALEGLQPGGHRVLGPPATKTRGNEDKGEKDSDCDADDQRVHWLSPRTG